MDQATIASVVGQLPFANDGDRRAVVLICELTAPADITPDVLLAAARGIVITFRSTRSWDDDCYWCGQSPFNHKWYVFAQDFRASAFIEDQYPVMMNE